MWRWVFDVVYGVVPLRKVSQWLLIAPRIRKNNSGEPLRLMKTSFQNKAHEHLRMKIEVEAEKADEGLYTENPTVNYIS